MEQLQALADRGCEELGQDFHVVSASLPPFLTVSSPRELVTLALSATVAISDKSEQSNVSVHRLHYALEGCNESHCLARSS